VTGLHSEQRHERIVIFSHRRVVEDKDRMNLHQYYIIASIKARELIRHSEDMKKWFIDTVPEVAYF